ncbi:MAG: hypothetical protein ACFBZ8_10990 [Opitutales bacterium]
MRVRGIAGRDSIWLNRELRRGGRFVVFDYTVSALLITWRRNSNIIFVRAGRHAWLSLLGCSLLTALCGWFGPGGITESLDCLRHNFAGGQDVTADLLRQSSDETTGDLETSATG